MSRGQYFTEEELAWLPQSHIRFGTYRNPPRTPGKPLTQEERLAIAFAATIVVLGLIATFI